MKTSLRNQRERGLTLVELFVVIVVLTVFVLFFYLPPDRNVKARALRIQCINNLKQDGLAYRVWADDNGGKYPMELSETNGGTMQFTSGPNAFRHFQVMSNELSTPKVLICPADDSRMWATNFIFLNNSNVSFFVGVDAVKTNPQGILSGDCNITNGTTIQNGILQVTTNRPAGWTAETHKKAGNILLADGSVQQVTTSGLQGIVANTGIFTNRLQMPILNP
jgi:prepilin-type processing-associated H-X9-DG protein